MVNIPANDRSRWHSYFESVLQSPLITITLSVFFLFALWNAYAIAKPWWQIDIPGFHVSQEPEVFILYFHPGCSCDNVPETWLNLGISHQKKIIVIADGESSALNTLKREFAQRGIPFLLTSDAPLIHRLAPQHISTLTRLRYGRVEIQYSIKQDRNAQEELR